LIESHATVCTVCLLHLERNLRFRFAVASSSQHDHREAALMLKALADRSGFQA
jgi:hypothetical protein